MVAITYHVLALTKLRMYGAAADELRGLGDLDASKYKHDGASTVPFALRYLAAELPFRLSQPQVRIPLFFVGEQTAMRCGAKPELSIDCLHMQELCSHSELDKLVQSSGHSFEGLCSDGKTMGRTYGRFPRSPCT